MHVFTDGEFCHQSGWRVDRMSSRAPTSTFFFLQLGESFAVQPMMLVENDAGDTPVEPEPFRRRDLQDRSWHTATSPVLPDDSSIEVPA